MCHVPSVWNKALQYSGVKDSHISVNLPSIDSIVHSYLKILFIMFYIYVEKKFILNLKHNLLGPI